MDPNNLLEFGTAVLASGAIKEPLQTLNDAWFNVFGVRVKAKRIKHEYELAELKKSLEDHLKDIPKENVQDPTMSILGPALESSKYYIEEPIMRDAIAKIAAGAFDNRLNNRMHPSFISFIQQMSQVDVIILRIINGKAAFSTSNSDSPTVTARISSAIPVVEYSGIGRAPGGQISTIYFSNVIPNQVLNTISSTVGRTVTFEETSASLNNLLRLGLLTRLGNIQNWQGKTMNELFSDSLAKKLAEKRHHDVISQLYSELHPEQNNHHVDLTIGFDSDDIKQRKYNQLKSMKITPKYDSYALNVLGSNFCDISM